LALRYMLKSRIRVGGSWEIYVYPESGFKSKILEIGLKKSTSIKNIARSTKNCPNGYM